MMSKFSRSLTVFLVVQISIGVFLFTSYTAKAAGTTYYVDNCVVVGSDSNNGTSLSTPWLTLAHVSAHSFTPGDTILLEGGCVWRESLNIGSSGTSGSPITVSSYGTGQAIIDGADILSSGWTNTAAATGTVTQSNMKLSMATDTAFVDFNASGTLTPYVGDKLTITDSSGHQLVGYIKAAGTGETYGSQLLTNTTFATTTGLTAFGSTIASVTSTCHSANCLQITYTSSGQVWNPFTANEGTLLKASAYGNQGTTSFLGMAIEQAGGSFEVLNSVFYNSSWTKNTIYPTIDFMSTSWWQKYQIGSGIGYIDTASVQQVLTPSTTGVTIVSSASGASFNWTSEQASFNRNDSSGYTYSISIPNIWQTPFAPSYIAHAWVFFNGVAGGPNGGNPQSSLGNVTTTNEWYWNGTTTLYVYSTSNPATAFTTPGVEASERAGVSASNKSYVTFSNLSVKDTSQSCFDLFQLTHGVVQSSTASYCGKNGIVFYNGGGSSDNYTISGSTVSYTSETGIAGKDSNNGAIYGNEVTHAGVQQDDEDGIGVVGNSGNNNVYNNYSHDSTDQTGSVGIRCFEDDTITSPKINYFYDNLAARCNGTGFIVEHSANQVMYGNISYGNTKGVGGDNAVGGFKDSIGSENIYYNNTTYNNQFAEMEITNNSGVGPILKNNIFYASASGQGAIFTNGTTPTSTVDDYNLLFGITNLYNWGGTSYTSSTFFSATGQGHHDVYGDPRFTSTSTGNFSVLVGSPAIDAGVNLGTSYDMGLDPASTWPSNIITDNQNSFGAGWDMGAYEYTQTSTPSVAIIAPTASSTVSGIISITVTSSAVAPASIASIQFYLDGSPLGSAVTSSPYTTSWNTTIASNSSHTLYALATDNYSNTATSSNISLAVYNAPSVSYGGGGGGGVPQSVFLIVPVVTSTTSSAPSVLSGMTVAEMQSLLVSLETELQALKAKAGITSSSYAFTRNLTIGLRGPDVQALQHYLNTHGFPVVTTSTYAGSLGYETQYFGKATQAALAEFQKSVGISPAVGFFGPITRVWVNGHQ